MRKKFVIFLAGLGLLLVIASIIVWQVVKASPQYSVYQLYQAIDQHDYEKFKQYFDVEGISNNIIDKAFSSVTEESKKDSANKDPFSQLGYNLGLTFVASMKPQLKETMISSIKKAVEDGTFKKDYKPKSIFDIFTIIEVKKTGKVADVFIKAQGKENLKLKMRDVNNNWQVFDMDLPIPETNNPSATPTTETTYQAKYGERVDISQGWFLTVESPEDYISTNYSTPKEGNKFVTTKITYENTTDKPDSYSTYNFKLKDNQNFSYSDTYSGKEPKVDSGELEANGKVTGYITFEMPKDNNPVSVVYSGSKSVIFISSNPTVTP